MRSLPSTATLFQDACIGVEESGEVRGVGGWVVLDQSPLDGDCFSGGLKGLALLPVVVQTTGEVVEGSGEVRGVGGWVVLG